MLIDYASNYAPNIYLIIKEEVHVKSEEISIDYTISLVFLTAKTFRLTALCKQHTTQISCDQHAGCLDIMLFAIIGMFRI